MCNVTFLATEADMRTALPRKRSGARAPHRAVCRALALASFITWPPSANAQPVRPSGRTPPDTACARMIAVALQDSSEATLQRARDCIESVDGSRRLRPRQRVTREIRRVGEMQLHIPEYHDEQRLPDGAGGLGPLALIYA